MMHTNCMHTCCIHTHTPACIYTYIIAQLYKHTFMQTKQCTYIYIAYIYTCIYLYVHNCLYKHTYIQTKQYTSMMHTYIHIAYIPWHIHLHHFRIHTYIIACTYRSGIHANRSFYTCQTLRIFVKYIHVHTYTYIHTYMHACIQTKEYTTASGKTARDVCEEMTYSHSSSRPFYLSEKMYSEKLQGLSLTPGRPGFKLY